MTTQPNSTELSDLEREIFAAQKRLLVCWLDWTKSGEDLDELIEETKYITGYQD